MLLKGRAFPANLKLAARKVLLVFFYQEKFFFQKQQELPLWPDLPLFRRALEFLLTKDKGGRGLHEVVQDSRFCEAVFLAQARGH